MGAVFFDRRGLKVPQVTNAISLGNIITIVSLLFVAGAAWSDASSRLTQQAAEIADHEARIRLIETRVGETLARIDERLASIERKLAKQPYLVQE